MKHLVVLLVVLVTACVAEPPVRPTFDEPVASYLGTDDVTAQRVSALLDAHGIPSIAYGSRGYTVAVSGASAPEARRLLADAIAHGLRASVIELPATSRASSGLRRPASRST